MNDLPPDSVLYSIERTIELFSQLRTADPTWVAAYDTLKQAHAQVGRALAAERRTRPSELPVLARAA